MPSKKKEMRVTNINRSGEVFDPSTITIKSGDIPGFDAAITDLIKKIAEK